MKNKNKRIDINYSILIKTFLIVYILSFFFNFREFSFGTNENYGKIAVAFSFVSFILAMLISELQIYNTHDYRIELIEVCLIFWAITAVVFLVCWLGSGNITIALVFVICPFWGILSVLKSQIANVMFLLVCTSEIVRLMIIYRRERI